MTEKTIKNIVKNHFYYMNDYEKAFLYYNNENDILRLKSPSNLVDDNNINPFRNADNRISHNWFNILVNQKAGYLFSYPPIFDVYNSDINKSILEILGDNFSKVCKDLCIEASLYGRSYLHFWVDDKFRYATIDARQVIPIYKNNITRDLEAVIRFYDEIIDQKNTRVYEYWTDNKLYMFYGNGDIKPYKKFKNKHILEHKLKVLPFIEFKNNNLCKSDLASVKSLIDVYDKVFSGFVNDVEDIQQVILVLSNYGGEDLRTFLSDLKRYKAIDIQSDDNNSGVSTMSIDIPIDARREILNITKKQIFTLGQGVDPDSSQVNLASGVALKHLYGLLDLKCGLMETEFRVSFNKFVRTILLHLNYTYSGVIDQTYTRCFVENDLEQAEILSKLADFTSKQTLAKNNPLVDDFENEIENLKGESYER